jgi:tripartite-type tricarboxylate transporter receptor subunit TctC
MKKLLGILTACLLGVVGPYPVLAQASFPERPITIVVPYAPGGASDTTARMVASEMANQTGYDIIVENRPGAGGSIAASQVARAKPDGYTLLLAATNTNGINTYMYPDLTYDAVKSFAPVGLAVENVVVLLANTSFPAGTLTEAIEAIRKDPGKYSYASPGVGTVHHLSIELLKKAKGLELLHVPYKGAGPAMIDLVAGTVPLMVGGIAPAKPFIESGKVKVLGVANDRKFDNLPEKVQYFSEVAPTAAVSSWLGLVAPARTPEDRIARLSDALKKALDSTSLQQALEAQGMQTEFMAPKAFGAHIEKGMPFWESAVDAAGIGYKQNAQ